MTSVGRRSVASERLSTASYARVARQPSAAESERAAAEYQHVIAELSADDSHNAAAIEDFFARIPPGDEPDGELPPHMELGNKRAMWLAIGMFGGSLLAIAGFIAFNQIILVRPVELGVEDAELGQESSLAAASDPAPAPPRPPPLRGPRLADPDSDSFDDLIASARKLSAEGQPQRALEAYERALRVQPQAPVALAGKAQAHLELGDSDAAKSAAELGVASDATNALAWLTLGKAEQQLGSPDAAQEAYRHCTEQGAGDFVAECRKLVRVP